MENKDLLNIANQLIESANQLDSKGRFAHANKIERIASRIVEAGFSGNYAGYVTRLLDLAKSKGIDYMKSRMEEARLVIHLKKVSEFLA